MRSMTLSAFSPWRITTMPPTTSPSPSRSATPRRISGPSATVATSFTEHRRAALGAQRRGSRGPAIALHVAAAADHVLACRENSTSRPPTSLFPVRTALDDRVERQLVGGERVRVHGDLVLAHLAADGRDLRHAGHALDRVAQVPVLERPQLVRRVLPGPVDERVLVHPADARRVRARARSSRPAGAARVIFDRYSSTRDRAQYMSVPSSKMT